MGLLVHARASLLQHARVRVWASVISVVIRTPSQARLRNKLRGRVGHSGRDLTVPELVSRLVRQATSLEALSQMYEGWMPWL